MGPCALLPWVPMVAHQRMAVPVPSMELDIAMRITRGQKVPDIAEQLHIATKTVNTYRYRLFDKLDISTDVELTHLALRHKLIDLA